MISLVLTFENGDLTQVEESFGSIDRVLVFDRDVSDQYMTRILNEVFRNNRKRNVAVRLMAARGNVTRFFSIDEVHYIESLGRIMRINSDIGSFEFYGRLYHIEQLVAGLGFMRVHKSYVVSMNRVRCSTGRYVEMDNGERISIGSTYLERYRQQVWECSRCLK